MNMTDIWTLCLEHGASRRYGFGNIPNHELERGLRHQSDHYTDTLQHGQRQQRKRKLLDDEILSLISSDEDSVDGMRETQSKPTHLDNVPVHEPQLKSKSSNHAPLQPSTKSTRYGLALQRYVPTEKSEESMNDDASDPDNYDADSAGGDRMPSHDGKVSSFFFTVVFCCLFAEWLLKK